MNHTDENTLIKRVLTNCDIWPFYLLLLLNPEVAIHMNRNRGSYSILLD